MTTQDALRHLSRRLCARDSAYPVIEFARLFGASQMSLCCAALITPVDAAVLEDAVREDMYLLAARHGLTPETYPACPYCGDVTTVRPIGPTRLDAATVLRMRHDFKSDACITCNLTSEESKSDAR